jgi:hypothetical protein
MYGLYNHRFRENIKKINGKHTIQDNGFWRSTWGKENENGERSHKRN